MGVTGLDHILLLCEDLDATAEFYRRALGLTVGARPAFDFPGRWLYAGGVPCVHLAQRRGFYARASGNGIGAVPEARPPLIDHIAFAATDYEGTIERLVRDGIEPVRRELPGGSRRQLFFRDPDGMRVELSFPATPAPQDAVGQPPAPAAA